MKNRTLVSIAAGLLLGLSLMLVAACAEQSLNKGIAANQTLAEAETAAAVEADKAGRTTEAADHRARAAAATKQVADLEAKRAAARKADDDAWKVGTESGVSIANVLFPGAALLVGAGGMFLQQVLRKKTFTDGQTDGAAQGAQGVATLRKMDPALNKAFEDLKGPTFAAAKTAIAAGTDDNVLASIAANKDTPLPEAAAVIADQKPVP